MILAKKIRWPASLRSLIFFLAVLPVAVVALISLFNPMLIQRGTLLFAPYLLIVIASGLASLVRRDRRWVCFVLISVVIHGFSILYFKSKPSNPDYKGLAGRWVSQIEESDLIFVHGRGHPYDWLVAPIFYYVKASRHQFVGRDFEKEIQKHPRSRVWVLSFPRIPTEKDALDALAGYELRERVDALNIFAQLHVREATGDTKDQEYTSRVGMDVGSQNTRGGKQSSPNSFPSQP